MTKKVIAVIVLTGIFFFSLIFTIPITILSNNFSSFDYTEESVSFNYNPNNSSTSEILNLKIDRGDVEIKYIYPPYEFVVKINIYFEISGANAQGKTYSEYFDILWENETSPLNFTMKYKTDVDQLEALSLFKNVSIVVNLRSDVIFDINAELKDGVIGLVVPYMVPINNIKVNNSKGNTFFDFTNCIISGTVTGITNGGDIELTAYNTKYTNNNNWELKSNTGDIKLFVTHSNYFDQIGANITGSGATNTGEILIVYTNKNPDIGALLTFYNSTTSDGDFEGFEQKVNTDPLYIRYTSDNFPVFYNYNFSFSKPLNLGNYIFLINNTYP